MLPSLQNMNLALAVIAFRALAHQDEEAFEKASSSISNFFSVMKQDLPDYEIPISKAIYLLGNMPIPEQKGILELVHSVSGGPKNTISPAKSAWSVMKYVSLFSKLFAYLQRPVADSISLCLAPLNKRTAKKEEYLCFGDIGLTTAFALALRGKDTDFVSFSAAYQLSAEFLDLIVHAEGSKGRIKRNIAVNVEGFQFSTNGRQYAGAFIFPNADARSFNLEPFMNAISSPLVFLIPSSLLWMRTTEDKKLRKDLVGGNSLKAVIMLPPNSVTDSSCDFSLLVLNTPSNENEVWFIDKSKQKVFQSRKRTLNDSLASFDILGTDEDSAAAKKEQLVQNDFNLNPKRYISSRKELFSSSEAGDLHQLCDVAEIIRAQEIPTDEDNWTLTVKEVMPRDINEIGLIVLPQKILLVSEKGEKRTLQATLKEGDILLSIKSGNWKCGLWSYKDCGYTANSCFVIIRIKDSCKKSLPPFYLMRLLRSSAIQKRLSVLSVGTRSPLLKMDDIRQITFPIPTKVQVEIEKEKFKKQIELLEEIQKKSKEIQSLNLEF